MGSSVFSDKQSKSYKVQFMSSEANKDRVSNIQDELKRVDPNKVFDLNALLEAALCDILSKAEKEISKLKA